LTRLNGRRTVGEEILAATQHFLQVPNIDAVVPSRCAPGPQPAGVDPFPDGVGCDGAKFRCLARGKESWIHYGNPELWFLCYLWALQYVFHHFSQMHVLVLFVAENDVISMV
jgi:hypothetical protein